MDGTSTAAAATTEASSGSSSKPKSKKWKRMERNKRRRAIIRRNKKEKVKQIIAKCKELESELATTKSKMMQMKATALQIHKERLRATPKGPRFFMMQSSLRCSIRSKPTASSAYRPTSHKLHGVESKSQVKKLERHSLSPCDSGNSEVGSGTFGKCTKMIYRGMEVAVKATTLDMYSYEDIMYEAVVMSIVCCGQPNLPLFFGVYDHLEPAKPMLVTKLYSVSGRPYTLYQCFKNEKSFTKIDVKGWARILVGLCDGLEAVHQRGYLHNDLKGDNVVMSDFVPNLGKAPPLWPIIIDFGKARPITTPRKYKLNEVDRQDYLKKCTHLAPELVLGSCSQSDVYSLGQIIRKAAAVSSNQQLKTIAKMCIKGVSGNVSTRPSVLYVHDSLSVLV